MKKSPRKPISPLFLKKRGVRAIWGENLVPKNNYFTILSEATKDVSCSLHATTAVANLVIPLVFDDEVATTAVVNLVVPFGMVLQQVRLELVRIDAVELARCVAPGPDELVELDRTVGIVKTPPQRLRAEATITGVIVLVTRYTAYAALIFFFPMNLKFTPSRGSAWLNQLGKF